MIGPHLMHQYREFLKILVNIDNLPYNWEPSEFSCYPNLKNLLPWTITTIQFAILTNPQLASQFIQPNVYYHWFSWDTWILFVLHCKSNLLKFDFISFLPRGKRTHWMEEMQMLRRHTKRPMLCKLPTLISIRYVAE